jgi:uncharacterized protein YpmB
MKKTKLIIIGVAVLLVIGFAAYYFLLNKTPVDNKNTTGLTQKEKAATLEADVTIPEVVTKICSAKYWLEKDADGNLKDCKEYSPGNGLFLP